jgi:mitofusin
VSALSSHPASKSATSSSVQLLWPRRRCRLLADDVVLLDSPGVDVEMDFDEW